MWTFVEETPGFAEGEDYTCETVDWVAIKKRDRIMDSV